jgi:hypothetical protein
MTKIIRGDRLRLDSVPLGLLPYGGVMLGWLRRIRRINLFGFELEFDHTPESSTPRNETKGVARGAAPCQEPAPVTTAAGAKFTVYGEVIRTAGQDIGVRVQNEAELREFWRLNRIDTKLDWFGPGAPVISIGRRQDIARCKIGDEVSLTFVVEDRAGGKRGIKTVDFEVKSRS